MPEEYLPKATDTVCLRKLLATLRQQEQNQQPYFDDRLLQKIETIEALLATPKDAK